MSSVSLNRWLWLTAIFLVRAGGLPFQLSPTVLPQNESQKLFEAAVPNDILIIFNAGGWGDAPLSRAVDFAAILEGIQQTLVRLGHRTTAVPYYRTCPGLAGKIAGTKEQLNSFKHTYKVQIKDIEFLAKHFPEKKFIIVGFSVGGGLSGRTLPAILAQPNIFGITVGVPGWFRTYSSEKSLVLNNRNQDPLSVGNVKTIASCVFKCPFNWLQARLNGQKLSVALALKFPYHDYSWSSPEIGPPIVKFLENNFKQVSR